MVQIPTNQPTYWVYTSKLNSMVPFTTFITSLSLFTALFFLHKNPICWKWMVLGDIRGYQHHVSTLFVLVLQKCCVLPGILPRNPSSTEREQIIAFVKTIYYKLRYSKMGRQSVSTTWSFLTGLLHWNNHWCVFSAGAGKILFFAVQFLHQYFILLLCFCALQQMPVFT